MKKSLLALLIIMTIGLSGCGNRQVLDTKWTFTKAKIIIGNEVKDVDVKTWKDYGNGDTSIQIVATDGTVYLTDLKNVILIGK